MSRTTGQYITTLTVDEAVQAYVPEPLPPQPSLPLGMAELDLLGSANRALGELNGLARMLPDVSLLVYLYVRKEAVLSSQIEGTQSSLSDLLLYESEHAPGLPKADAAEVSRYVRAMRHGLTRMQEGFPLCGRLLREIHEVLLSDGRGSQKQPGEFRTSQNWIGGTRPGNAVFVPPPPDRVHECMAALEHFLHDQSERTPTLLKAALAHVQFETIHPFLDGNGRLGRLLVTLLLCAEEATSEPILYLSLYLKRNRDRYYALLQQVREQGDWEAWVRFFLQGVVETANNAVEAARQTLALFDTDRKAINALKRAAGSALRVHEALQRRPVASVAELAADTTHSQPTVNTAVGHLETLHIVREVTGKQRDRLYLYGAYVDLLSEGTEPL